MAFGQSRQRALIAASWPRGWLWRGVQPADLAPVVDPVRAAVLVRPQTLHDGAHVLLGAGLLTLFEPRHPSLIIREQQRSHRGYRWLGPPAPTVGVGEALDQSRRVIVPEQPRDRTVRQWLLSGVVPLAEQPELYRIAILRQESLRDIPRTWLQAGVPPDPFVPIELDASRRVIVLRELSRHVDRGWLRSGVMPVDLGSSSAEDLRVMVPYLIGDTQDAALMRIASIYCIADVTGSSGTVIAQIPAAFTLVERDTLISITLGGAINSAPGKRGQTPYGLSIH